MMRAVFALLAVSILTNFYLAWRQIGASSKDPARSAASALLPPPMPEDQKKALRQFLLSEIKSPEDQVDAYFRILEEYEGRVRTYAGFDPSKLPDYLQAERHMRDIGLKKAIGQRGFSAANWWMSPKRGGVALKDWLGQDQPEGRCGNDPF